MYLVYVIYSAKLNRYYTGTTDNIERRLQEHNDGVYKDSFTSRGMPWKIYLVIGDLESKQAYDIESYLKRMKSSAYLEKLKEQPEVVEWLKTKFK
jgi:putative endonuclease